MAKLLVGIVIGIIMSADTFMVGFCIWYERQHPEVSGNYLLSATRDS